LAIIYEYKYEKSNYSNMAMRNALVWVYICGWGNTIVFSH